MRGQRNTVEIVLFEISTSMKPYPSAFHANTSKLRLVIGFFEPTDIDEVSNRIPPTSQRARGGVRRARNGAVTRRRFEASFRGNHLSNTTCLTHDFFKSGESCSEFKQ